MLKMDLEYKTSILFIRLFGSLERKTTYKINNYIVPALVKHKIKNIIYNLENLKNIDEAGVDAILNTKCIMRKNKGNIILCGVSDFIGRKVKRLKLKTTKTEKTALKIIEV